jgi:hypothetical protein
MTTEGGRDEALNQVSAVAFKARRVAAAAAAATAET